MQARFFYIYKFVPNKPGWDGRRAMPDADMNFELNHHDVWSIYTQNRRFQTGLNYTTANAFSPISAP